MAIITNPKTNREIHVKEFLIDSKDVSREEIRTKSVKSIGWMILEQGADLAWRTIFENILDYRLGGLGIDLLKRAYRDKKHYQLRIGVSRKGDIYAIKSGQLLTIIKLNQLDEVKLK